MKQSSWTKSMKLKLLFQPYTKKLNFLLHILKKRDCEHSLLEQKHLLYYKYYHGYYAHLNGFKVSDKISNLIKIDLDNDSDFFFQITIKSTYLKFYENIKDDGEVFLLLLRTQFQKSNTKSQSLKTVNSKCYLWY
jgi:hypothetical protein